MCLHERFNLAELPVLDVYAAGHSARRSDDEGTVARIRKGVEDLFRSGQLGWCVATTGVLVETLLARSADGDTSEAETAIERMAAIPFDKDTPGRDILLLRLRALLARARGDEARYCDYRDRYRDMARTLCFEGHIEWAEAMP
jgi:hypothetical protein